LTFQFLTFIFKENQGAMPMTHNSETPLEAAERFSSAVVDAIAPLVETVSQEEDKEGLVLLGTSLVTAGTSLLQGVIGDSKAAEFIDQLRAKLMRQFH